ncbi:MAG TPA: CDP-alcohol phosphatidyltransferase family protein [Caulobacteraceae bacterium]|nr:CDP-alcohol phosphatidyltransferase family protein [Caulobacteraceae bacterium]
MSEDPVNRRPLKIPNAGWIRRLATFLARGGVTPNQVSFIGVTFAVLGASSLGLSGLISGAPRVALLIVAAISIQLRMLCGLLDAMVAVELGKGKPSGAIWHELPDRFADFLLLAGAGYGAITANFVMGPAVGWLAAVLAVIAAYVRELGRGEGLAPDFSGPLAKPQRMALLTLAVIASCFDGLWTKRGVTLMVGVGAIAILTAVTIGVRVLHLARALKNRPTEKP